MLIFIITDVGSIFSWSSEFLMGYCQSSQSNRCILGLFRSNYRYLLMISKNSCYNGNSIENTWFQLELSGYQNLLGVGTLLLDSIENTYVSQFAWKHDLQNIHAHATESQDLRAVATESSHVQENLLASENRMCAKNMACYKKWLDVQNLSWIA